MVLEVESGQCWVPWICFQGNLPIPQTTKGKYLCKLSSLWIWTLLPILNAERFYKFWLWDLDMISQKCNIVKPSLKLIKQLFLYFKIVRITNRCILKKITLLTVLLQTKVWKKCLFYLKAIRGHLWEQCPGADLPVPCQIWAQVGIWLGLKPNYKQTNKFPRVKSALWINLGCLVK